MRGAGRRRGYALIVVLVVGTTLLMLALATSTLALVQLRSASYLAAAQQARAAAEAGVLLIGEQLRYAWQRDGRFPSNPPDVPPGSGFELRVISYHAWSDGEAEFEVEARHDGAVAVAGGRSKLP